MAIKWSPGCGCCRKCNVANLKWIPSSPYDRGEYTDDDRWRPFTEYLQGDQFWEESTDRNGDTHKFLFTAPATMFSGGGWTLTEEARYSRGRGISYADGLQDFELLTNAVGEAYGFPLDQIRLHEALQQRRLYEGQGLISRKEIAKEEWIATWNVEVKSTEEYDDMEMESLSVRIKFMGSAEYDSEVDTEPTSGIVTVVSKAAPDERVTSPYPESCIPICETNTEEVWNPDDPQCGPKPPFKPEWKIEHGTFTGTTESLSETWSNAISLASVTNARSTQPENAAVLGKLDVANQVQFSDPRADGEPLNLHDQLVLEQCFGATNGGKGFADGFENHAIQNAVTVVIEGGEVTQGGDPFTVEAGDIIQIVDFTKLDDRGKLTGLESPFGTLDSAEDGAFLHIPADSIVEEDRTSYLSDGPKRKPSPLNLTGMDVEVAKDLGEFTGGKLAVYVEEFSDTDGVRTRDGDYFCQFGFNMCKVETPSTITNPDCEPVPAYECNCRPLSGEVSPGLDLTFTGNYPEFMWFIDELGEGYGSVEAGQTQMEVIDRSDGISWVGPFTPPTSHQQYDKDCHAKFGQFALATDWQLRKYSFAPSPSGPLRPPPLPTYGFAIKVSVVVEHTEIRLLDCIGKIDSALLGRSAVHAAYYVSDDLTNLGGLIGDSFFVTEDAAREEMEKAIARASALASQAGYGYLCNGGSFTNDQMTHGVMGLTQIIARDMDGDGDVDQGDIDRAELGSAYEAVAAASFHEWSLQSEVNCNNVVTFKFPASEAEIDAQRDGRHYLGGIFFNTPDPLFFLNTANFPGNTSVSVTRGGQ